MKLEIVALQENNKVMQSYNNDKDFLHTFFDYKNEESSYPERLEELAGRTFGRTQLAETIRSFMEPFGISANASKHIDELSGNAVVVIGGQQAGILTGPLYSVHKAITVILLAKEQRDKLGVPVVPVFWVAGEDHDLNEINHVYTRLEGRATKHQYRENFVLKLMASDAEYDKELMASLVKDIFGKFGETAYTKDLLDEVLGAVDKEETFTRFFVRLMNGLFKEEGLLFIDSATKQLRELEKSSFAHLIEESEQLAKKISKKEELFVEKGFGSPLVAEIDAANLFYVHDTGRVLLSRKDDYFVNESLGLRFSKTDMLKIAQEEPWLLSNNVATRPLMQDMVFPVLAFVGGPGEIAYWAVLKEAFHHLGMKMPIIVPRMSMTLVTPQVKHTLSEKNFTVEDVMSGAVVNAREHFVKGLHDECFDAVLNETENMLDIQYKKIAEFTEQQGQMMQELLKKNLLFHTKQLDYLKGKAEEAELLKHDTVLRAFGLLEGELFPEGVLQERLYTPYTYLNSYGPTLIQELLRLPLVMDGTHKVIYL
ncbi:bacillithiol biosynthesis cysteine-adding enzyme BshC [Sporosarcina sp. ANT_H38]|uniref:bacillithiol biosynthesis cysteine-adding enzyme BshC n=1 Tax=Sporosarcina sp. ANT_H38 TaxID=2597358 RepID=UPI0011F23EAC|nr:bacillithiol biosynthesis cysteine-adding enzyme BshC [Sporosarcina sp. ANT_H38]KAA0966608.1 bacillithiol biosynthesis cysteine-adding enzyme BshC [Sporosarcina sp. ANT_H38]